MKKIMFLSGADFKEKSIRVIKETPTQFAKKNWDVHYFVFRDTSESGSDFYEDEIIPKGVKVYRSYWPFPRIRACKYRSIRLLTSKLASILVVLQLFLKGLFFLLKNKDCDYVYGYGIQGVLASNILKIFFWKRKIFFIARFQGVFYIKEHFKNKRYLNLIFNFDDLLALWLPSNLMIMTNDGTQGDWVLKKIKSKGSKNLLFISNGVVIQNQDSNNPCNLFTKYSLDENKPYILMVSRLVQIKRVHLAIEAIAKLKKENYTFSYTILVLGDGTELKNLIDLTHQLQVADHFLFLGPIPNDEVYHFMKICKCMISLYKSSNIGNPFFESMLCSLPVIAVNNGDTNIFIKNNHNGILLNEESIVDDLVHFFKKIEQKEINFDALSKGAKEYATNNLLSWEQRIQKEIDAINDLSKGVLKK